MDLGLSGLASGFDWRSLVDQLADAERTPQKRLAVERLGLQERRNSYGSILTQLNVLQTRLQAVKSDNLFQGRTAQVGDAEIANASVSPGAVQGTYTFAFNQLASSAKWNGATGAGKNLSTTADVSGVVLGSAGFASPVTAGTFRVNGAEVKIATTDTLKDVFDKISTATGGTVTATYLPASDKIRLSSAQAITLGSATDTSNFLTVAKLSNSGTGTITSGSALGSVRANQTLAQANLTVDPTFDSNGAGMFKVNGVEIAYRSSDTVADVLARITRSDAGVVASYDAVQDRFVLANKDTGDMGIAVEDVTGNFLAATRLSTGSLERGKDLLYTINGGGVLRSHSNTVTESSSALAGLSVTALKEGASTTVTVATDRAAIKTAITNFIEAYNNAQKRIDSETELKAGTDGKVTSGPLASEGDAEGIASNLRKLVYGSVSGLSGTLSHLAGLGIKSNSEDDTLEIADDAALEDALTNRLEDVRNLFMDPSNGIATRLASYLDKAAGESGTVVEKQTLLDKQSSDIETQISDLERVVQSNRERMIETFVQMEKAQATIKQQLSFLQQRFGS